ncbi:MAG: hypothetical protein N3A69_05515, partial [Leptospiraceae bacterium]|nr:hypothetical protein [Leptospiraceae bacterium]
LELGMWASALNYSKCKLFVILLLLEDEFFSNSNDWFFAEESKINYEKLFFKMAYVVTTSYNLRVPRLLKILHKGRTVLERGITFYKPPD